MLLLWVKFHLLLTVGGQTTHHNASMQVIALGSDHTGWSGSPTCCRIVGRRRHRRAGRAGSKHHKADGFKRRPRTVSNSEPELEAAKGHGQREKAAKRERERGKRCQHCVLPFWVQENSEARWAASGYRPDTPSPLASPIADPFYQGVQADLFYCGPAGSEKAVVEQLIAEIGLRPIYLGDSNVVEVVDDIIAKLSSTLASQLRGRHCLFPPAPHGF